VYGIGTIACAELQTALAALQLPLQGVQVPLREMQVPLRTVRMHLQAAQVPLQTVQVSLRAVQVPLHSVQKVSVCRHGLVQRCTEACNRPETVRAAAGREGSPARERHLAPNAAGPHLSLGPHWRSTSANNPACRELYY
jgi:hypothetical protein